MAIVQPGRPDPTQTVESGGQIGASEAAPSESGMGLEATLPSVPLRPSLSEHLAPLDEPSGAFGPPTARSNGPVSRLESAPPNTHHPPAVPLKDNKDNFDARFESVL